jgi:hypothetical protein
MTYAQHLRPKATIVQIDLRTALECSDFAAGSELPTRVATKNDICTAIDKDRLTDIERRDPGL